MDFNWEVPDFRRKSHVACHDTIQATHDFGYYFPMPTPRMESHQLGAKQLLPPFDAQNAWHTNQANGARLASAQASHMPTPNLWNPCATQPVIERSLIPPSPTVVDERHSALIMSTSFPAYNPSHGATHHTAFDPPNTFLLDSDTQPPFSFVDQQASTLWHPFLDQSGTTHVSSHVAYPSSSTDSRVTESFIPNDSTRYQSPSAVLPPSDPHPVPSVSVETDPRSHLTFHRMVHRDSTGSSHRRRAARAIKYDGLWFDEAELLEGLSEPDARLNVHQCRWEEDRSPCHLWIRGDKSSINMHVQKWHGAKPGGDKSQVRCRWSACGRTMLKESIARHIVSIHLEEMWECRGCGKAITRSDAYGRHAERSDFEACKTSGALITYSADAREINARVALHNGGSLR